MYVGFPGDNRTIDSFNDGGCCLNDVDVANLVVDAESKVKLAIIFRVVGTRGAKALLSLNRGTLPPFFQSQSLILKLGTC